MHEQSEDVLDALVLARTLAASLDDPEARAQANALTAILRASVRTMSQPSLVSVTRELEGILRDERDRARIDRIVALQLAMISLRETAPRERGWVASRLRRRDPSSPNDAGIISGAGVASVVVNDHQLLQAADGYAWDARRGERVAATVALTALAVGGLAVVIALRAQAGEAERWGPETVLLLGVPAGLLLAATLIGRQAARLHRGAAELRRVQRQLQTVTAYLQPLPDEARHFMRAALVRRIFPPLIDDDPLREDDWFPADDLIISSIRPDLAETFLTEED